MVVDDDSHFDWLLKGKVCTVETLCCIICEQWCDWNTRYITSEQCRSCAPSTKLHKHFTATWFGHCWVCQKVVQEAPSTQVCDWWSGDRTSNWKSVLLAVGSTVAAWRRFVQSRTVNCFCQCGTGYEHNSEGSLNLDTNTEHEDWIWLDTVDAIFSCYVSVACSSSELCDDCECCGSSGGGTWPWTTGGLHQSPCWL